ncbi:hypothetical protein VUR80DRAFT_1712 [Thermomyces stellatus]
MATLRCLRPLFTASRGIRERRDTHGVIMDGCSMTSVMGILADRGRVFIQHGAFPSRGPLNLAGWAPSIPAKCQDRSPVPLGFCPFFAAFCSSLVFYGRAPNIGPTHVGWPNGGHISVLGRGTNDRRNMNAPEDHLLHVILSDPQRRCTSPAWQRNLHVCLGAALRSNGRIWFVLLCGYGCG